MSQKINVGMIGGGSSTSFGAVHREAMQINGNFQLVAGCFSQSHSKSLDLAKDLNIKPERVYVSPQEMLSQEKLLPVEERVQVIVIVTPNHLHFDLAKLALENDFHIILEKPITLSLDQALELQKIQEKSGKLCCVNYSYCGYPMIKQARAFIEEQEIGKIRKVIVEYHQGWLSNDIPAWRTDPKQSGLGGTVADIGTHTLHIAEYVSGLCATALSADLQSFVPGRMLDDDATVLLKMENGATGLLTASQIAIGEDNHISVKVFGDQGHLKWNVSEPNLLSIYRRHKPKMILRAGLDNEFLHESLKERIVRPPSINDRHAGAMANHYHNFARALNGENSDYPTLSDGIRGMAFIEACVNSSKVQGKWISL